jgi:hypothetical protein
MRLLEAQMRSGPDTNLSLDQIRELTPPGWTRVGENNMLERENS